MALPFTRQSSEGLLQASDPKTPRSELVHLAVHRSPEVRAAVAARRDCPFATMLALVYDSHDDVLEALTVNPNVPRAVLEVLMTHRHEKIRIMSEQRLRFMVEVA